MTDPGGLRRPKWPLHDSLHNRDRIKLSLIRKCTLVCEQGVTSKVQEMYKLEILSWHGITT